MSRILVLVLVGLLTASGTAGACSLAVQPFENPTWDGQLRYFDGGALRMKDGSRDVEITSGFFITYAVQGDVLVVSGQDGLGADCSGEDWLRVVEDGRVRHEEAGPHRVFHHDDGAIVVEGQEARLVPWGGGDERALSRLPDDAWAQAWSPALHPAFEVRGVFHAGARTFESPSGERPAAASGPEGTGVLVVADGRATLYEVPDDPTDPVRMRSWPASEGWPVKLAWADGWRAIASDELFVVGDEVRRVAIGSKAVSLGERSGRLLAFHEDGYVELDGTRAVGGANLEDGTWQAARPTASTKTVPATLWTTTDAWGESSADPTNGDGGTIETIPFVAPALLLVALALVTARRPRP